MDPPGRPPPAPSSSSSSSSSCSSFHRSPRPRITPRQSIPKSGLRDVFPKFRGVPRGVPKFTFLIAGRQTGRRCRGRVFQTLFQAAHGAGHGSRYGHKLPVIGRGGRPPRRWPRAEYSLHLLL
uniref:TATA-box binding protein associated factor 6 like n=1 Tax=Hypotaenidia okinawae TaxID=2861861 RepID=A0A6G1S1V5_9GRUI